MTTYIYGTDTYRIKDYLAEHAPNAIVGIEALKTKGLFDQAPVILYEPSPDHEIPKDVEVFVVSEKKIKKGLEFKPLKDNEIKEWIQEYVKKSGYAIEPNALLLLTSRYVDTWQTKLELDKLASYCHSKGKIERMDLDAVSIVSVEENIFKLTNAMAGKRKGEAVLLLDRQLASGADPYYLFSMVVFQFRNMIAPNRPDVKPYPAQMARMAAQSFEPGILKKLYGSLHQLEIDAKSGIQDMEDGLYQFVFKL